MNSIHCLKRWLTATLAVLTLLMPMTGQAVAPATWKDTGFSVDAQGLTLHDVLRDFSRVYGVTLSVEVDDTVRLKGRFKADSGTDFLDRLGQAYHFNWFVSNGTLFIVSRTDNTSMRLQIGEDAVQDAKAALVGLGLFDPRFGWGELPDEGIVIVSGPRRYVELARDVLLPDEKKLALKERQVMMFRLKYASATDRTITTRGKTEIVPGVKTILSGLLFGPSSPAKSDEDKREIDAGSNKRSHSPKIDKGDSREVPLPLFGGAPKSSNAVETAGQGKDNERAWKSKDSSSDDVKPRIEANPALNAILIYDKLNKRPVYQSLIDQLDVEPQQVEIEAIIVDIDRSKLSDLGVEWGFRSGNTTTTINGTRADSAGSALPIPGATLMISNVARFYARLKALEGTGEAQVLATPTVLTLDNVAAVLDLSQTAYVPLTGERVADLADITAGTMLRVIPRIIQDGKDTQVHMDVDIEDGGLDTTGTKINATRSTISTQAIVDLQQTLMIGGYHSDSVSRDHQKTPVLGDIPLFGNLFKSTTDTSRSRERLFLITPRLVGGAAARAAAAERKAAARQTAEIHNTLRREAPAVSVGQKAFGDQTARIKGASDLSIIDWKDQNQAAGETKPHSALQSEQAARQPAGSVVPAAAQASPGQPAPIVEQLPASSPAASLAARAEPAPASAAASKPMTAEATVGTVVMPPRPVKYKCARPKGTRLLPA